MLSPCLTPTSSRISYILFPIWRTTIKYWYILWIAEQKFGGASYIYSTLMNNSCPAVSKALTRLEKSTKFGRLWLFFIFKRVLVVKMPSLKLIFGIPTNWNFVLWVSNISKQHTFMTLRNILNLLFYGPFWQKPRRDLVREWP